jgi:hypothetical protein
MHAFQQYSARSFPLAVAAVMTMVFSAPAAAQERETNAFTWSGNIPNGRRIAVHNINGAIRVERSSSSRVEVTADKEWRRGNPRDVRIEQSRASGDDVVICAMWSVESTCDADGINTPRRNRNNDDDRDRNRNNDVAVRFTVRVPDGVRVEVNTVNGELEISGATTEVDASTVNGSIRARSAGGPVRAKTVNGSIDVAMGSLGNVNDLDYETVNGSVTIEVPSNISAQLDLSTVNGRINTDFPITVSGSLSPRRLRGTVGGGAMRLRASTVNGGITLRRGS